MHPTSKITGWTEEELGAFTAIMSDGVYWSERDRNEACTGKGLVPVGEIGNYEPPAPPTFFDPQTAVYTPPVRPWIEKLCRVVVVVCVGLLAWRLWRGL